MLVCSALLVFESLTNRERERAEDGIRYDTIQYDTSLRPLKEREGRRNVLSTCKRVASFDQSRLPMVLVVAVAVAAFCYFLFFIRLVSHIECNSKIDNL